MKPLALVLLVLMGTLLSARPAFLSLEFAFTENAPPQALVEDDLDWQSLELPRTFAAQEGGRLLLIRGTVEYNQARGDRAPYLHLGNIMLPFEAYLNHIPVLFLDSFQRPRHHFRTGQEHMLVMPPLWEESERNLEFTMRIWKDGEELVLQNWSFLEEEEARIQRLREFFNVDFYAFLAAVSLFVFVFFGVQFMAQRDDRAAGLFALTNLFMGGYFIRFGNPVSWLPFFHAYTISKALLFLSLGFLLVFYTYYFSMEKKTILRWMGLGVGIFSFLVVAFLPRTYTELQEIFIIFLLPAALLLVCMVIIPGLALKKRQAGTVIIFWGSFLGVLMGMHDILVFSLGVTPFLWLQGYGIFVFNLSIFFSYVIRAIKTGKDLDESNELLEQTNRKMEEQLRLREQFLANTSHELLTPLNGILGLAEDMDLEWRRQGDYSPDREPGPGIQRLLTLGGHLSDLSRQLLESSRDRYRRPQELSAEDYTLTQEEGREWSIWIVDDDEINRRVLIRQLRGQDHLCVRQFENPLECLQALEKNLPDLILMDVMMPGMSGYELTRAIRKEFSREVLPILFLSARIQAEDEKEGLDSGGNAYLQKPCDRETLLQAIRRLSPGRKSLPMEKPGLCED